MSAEAPSTPVVLRSPIAVSGERALAVLCAVLGLTSVCSLLAWVFGLGRFSSWFLAVSLPGTAALTVIAFALHRTGHCPSLRAALVTGTFGGLVGTIGYDLFRLPFAALGMRVFAPIDSYGVLLLDASTSNPLTGLAGWCFHFANGIGFGVTYAAIGLGRRWEWAVAWAMVLETATLVTPFAGTYGLSGRWGFIGVAYAAHLAYGAPLGRIVADPVRWLSHLADVGGRGLLAALSVTAVVLVAWHRPFVTPERVRVGEALAPGPSAVLVDGRLAPQWLRVSVGGCAVVRNDDDDVVTLRGADGRPSLAPGETASVCFSEEGVHRIRTSDEPYAGGFVIVDPALRL